MKINKPAFRFNSNDTELSSDIVNLNPQQLEGLSNQIFVLQNKLSLLNCGIVTPPVVVTPPISTNNTFTMTFPFILS